MENRVRKMETDVAVIDQRVRVGEHRMSQVEEDIRSLRSHMDRGQVIIGLLVILVPVGLEIWFS